MGLMDTCKTYIQHSFLNKVKSNGYEKSIDKSNFGLKLLHLRNSNNNYMKYILLFVLTIFLLNGCQKFEVKDKNAEMQKLTNENKELREYVKSLRTSRIASMAVGLDLAELYMNIDNPISVAVSGFLEEEISITVENGTYKKAERGWLVRPTSADKGTLITVHAMIDGESRRIFSRYFQARSIPLFAYIQLSSDNKEITAYLSENQLSSIKNLKVKWEYAPRLPFKVLSFSMLYFDSEKNVMVKEKSTGSEFTEKQREILVQLKAGNAFCITDIIVIEPGNVERELPPMGILICK